LSIDLVAEATPGPTPRRAPAHYVYALPRNSVQHDKSAKFYPQGWQNSER